MSAITRAAMHVRVRRLFLEESSGSTDFIDTEDIPDEIDQAYDEGAFRQHAMVIDRAAETGRLEQNDNAFLAYWLSRSILTVVAGTRDYATPADMYRAIFLTRKRLAGDSVGRRALFVQPSMDRLIQTFPDQFAPGKGETWWTIVAHGDSASPPDPIAYRYIRLYVYGNLAVPNEATTAEFIYYRKPLRVAYASPPSTNVDTPDPYNDAPVYWATAQLQIKAGDHDSAEKNRGRFQEAVDVIMPAPKPPQLGGGR